jgi:hypothetical protein
LRVICQVASGSTGVSMRSSFPISARSSVVRTRAALRASIRPAAETKRVRGSASAPAN